MFTESDREEFKEVFAQMQLEVLETLLHHKVLPGTITYNGEKVGIQVSFHKCDASEADACLDPPPVLEVW